MNEKQRSIKIKMLQAAIIILLSLLLIIAMTSIKGFTSKALSGYGSTGAEVRQIQTRLKNWGYYDGSVDGIYGIKTQNAVTYFQRKNGLSVDGVAGSETLAALGLPSSGSYGKYSKGDYYLIARTISAEARGEPYVGQVAVGAVILNRVESPSFPDTVAGVIYQPGAFSCLDNGQFNQPITDSAYRAAQDAINGWDPSNGAIYYYNPQTAISSWIRNRPIMLTIGKHVFCK